MPRKPNPAKKERYHEPFPTALRYLMRKNGETQEDIKGILGLANRQSVTGYVDGSTEPTPDKIIAVAKHYGVSADYLLGLGELPDTNPGSRAAKEYTGLSEGAVAALHALMTDYNGADKQLLDVFSGIIADEGFQDFLWCCACVARARYGDDPLVGFHDYEEREEFSRYRASKAFDSILDRAIKTVFKEQEAAFKASDEGWEEAEKGTGRAVTDGQG